MSRKKPAKIKRYRRSFTGAGSHMNTIRTVLIWAVVIVVLFGLGWLIAKPGLDLASRLWYNHKNNPASSSSETVESAPPTSQPVESEQTQQPLTAGGNWAIVSLTAVSTPEQAAETAKALAAQQVQYAVITLKDETGALYYASASALGKNAISASAIDAAAVAKAFVDAGVTPVAGIWAFKDASAPYADRTTAVKYQDTDYNWLDNSQELGGKPWLNPNNAAAQQYIEDVIAEVTALGYQKTLVFGLQFPTGYSLDSCGYGAMTQSKEALLASLGKRYEGIAGAEVWFCFEQSAIDGTNLTAYGASPASFGLANVFVRASAAIGTEVDSAASVPPVAQDTVLSALQQAVTDGGSKQTGYWLSGSTGEELSAANKAASAAGFGSVVIAQ